jgi:hypothetical protein
MRRLTFELLGMAIVLGLFAAGGVKGQGKRYDLTGATVTIARGPQWPSVDTQKLGDFAFPYPSSSGGVYKGASGGLKGEPDEVKTSMNRRSPLLIGMYVIQGVLQGLDAQSTIRALHSGTAREGNPLANPFASTTAAIVAFKVAVAAGSIYGTDRLYKHHPRLAMGILGTLNGEYIYVVQHNYRIVGTH